MGLYFEVYLDVSICVHFYFILSLNLLSSFCVVCFGLFSDRTVKIWRARGGLDTNVEATDTADDVASNWAQHHLLGSGPNFDPEHHPTLTLNAVWPSRLSQRRCSRVISNESNTFWQKFLRFHCHAVDRSSRDVRNIYTLLKKPPLSLNRCNKHEEPWIKIRNAELKGWWLVFTTRLCSSTQKRRLKHPLTLNPVTEEALTTENTTSRSGVWSSQQRSFVWSKFHSLGKIYILLSFLSGVRRWMIPFSTSLSMKYTPSLIKKKRAKM